MQDLVDFDIVFDTNSQQFGSHENIDALGVDCSPRSEMSNLHYYVNVPD